MKKYIEQEGNQQNLNSVESPASDVKVPTVDASSQDISSQSKVLESPVADGDVSTEDVSVSNNSLQPTVSGSRPVRNRRPPVWMKDYIHS